MDINFFLLLGAFFLGVVILGVVILGVFVLGISFSKFDIGRN
ncbi:35044_t:CDS:1, partial [Gigaspora margarita]